MSIIVHAIGFTLLSTIVTAAVIDLYKRSQENLPEEWEIDEDEEKEPTIGADLLWLGIESSKIGLQSADKVTDKVFNNPVASWLSWKVIEPFQLQPDGKYLKSRAELAWEGYETDEDVPVYRPGKFEMQI